MPALSVRGVRKRYTRRGPWILAGVDLAVEPGTATLVHGGNGSGKSTLLRVAAGVIDPTAGHVERAAAPVAYVPERTPAQIRMTASDYVGHMGRIRGLDAGVCSARAAELFARFALEPGPDVPVATLSKGNRQQLMLTQAFLEPVGLLALDEPFAGLDRDAHGTLASLIADARAGGAAVVVTGHGPPALPGADRVLRIADGALHADEPVLPAPRVGVRVGLTRGAGSPVVFVVAEPRGSDDLLRRALAAGWSVASVEPLERA